MSKNNQTFFVLHDVELCSFIISNVSNKPDEHFPMVLVLCVAEQSWVDREYAAVGAAGVEGAGAGRAISELHHLCSESSRPRSRVKPDRELGDPSENYGFKIRAEISEQQTCIVPRTDVQVGQVCVKMLLLERTAH